ncbi:hypothetical protein L596_017630 [Steinernema carpocapsae]|uniref:Uncharacterized protein n=1 Tax=Steinernema carpocapsae TaxID=34508 RepID=A0A4V6A1S8_STECR|nr:hypothetical protein L596_017630 [Steinernema carpocapsae]
MLNIFTMTPGFVVSTVILYVAFTSKSLRGQFKILIVALAFCSLFAVVVTLAFHLWFIAQLRCQKTIYFMTCSVMKRLFDHAQTPRIFCNLANNSLRSVLYRDLQQEVHLTTLIWFDHLFYLIRGELQFSKSTLK